jgi:hypothetical protein
MRDYTQEIADAICERIGDGESLRSICADEGMPNKATVFRWLAVNSEFRDQYARARETQADSLVDDILLIADTEDDPQKARVKIDARKWIAGKMRPKVYGDKLDLNHSGEVSVTRVEVAFVRPETQDR